MQKKSLLVALFCGALCLTGCLKNEESASVAQVRIAKANELNSIADLNKAKAQAEVIYANAEATIAAAEAKLREANAALVLAQAETEKVRAELLKVQVELQEVIVDEERVKLQLLEADLEKHLAEVEAAVAKAESEKQKWVNELEHLLAQAEIQAVTDAQALLTAEESLAKYLLKLEGEKLDSAKAYSEKYFYALNQVQTLQKQQIQTKATKALVEAGAMEIRDIIHAVMDDIDDQIAEKEELVAYLQEHQNMDPEEAEVALKEARIKLENAYNAYKAAQEAQSDAEKAYNDVKNQVSAFTFGWDRNFANFVRTHWGRQMGPWYNSYVRTKEIADYEDYSDVAYVGYYDRSDRSKFIKLWKVEDPKTRTVLYPTIEEQSVRNSFNTVKEMVIAPAEIFYENIETVLDSIADRQKVEVAKAVQNAKDASAEQVKSWKNTIASNTEKLTLHQKYVDARKDTIAKYENAIDSLVAAYNQSEAGKKSALQEYREYMVLTYEVPTHFFEDEIEAAADTVDARSAWITAKTAFEQQKTKIETTLTTDQKNAHDADSIAKKAYTDALALAETRWTSDFNNQYKNAAAAWSPVFEGSYQQTTQPGSGDGTTTPLYYKYSTGKYTVDHITTTVPGTTLAQLDTTGSTQLNWMIASGNKIKAEKEYNAAVAAYNENPTTANASAKTTKQEALATATGTLSTAEFNMEMAEGDFEAADRKYQSTWGAIETAKEAWNPEFKDDKYVANGTTLKYDATNKVWFKMVAGKKKTAGSAQGDLFMADSVLYAANVKLGQLETAKNQKETTYRTEKGEWEVAFNALLQALGKTEEEYTADPKVAEYYAKTKTGATVAKYEAAWIALQKRYGMSLNSLPGAYLNYVAPVEDYNDYYTNNRYNNVTGLGWINSNYHLNPDFEIVTYVGPKNGKIVVEKQSVAEYLYDGNKTNSLSVKNTTYTKNIADEPENLQKRIDSIENGREVQQLKQDIADIKAALEEYKGYEKAYKTWVKEREEAFKAWNEAKKDTYDANDAQKEALSAYKGIETLANGGMWVYDPDAKLYMKVYNKTSKPDKNQKGEWEDGFTFIELNDAIEAIEGSAKDLSTIFKSLSKVASTTAWATTDMRIDDREVINILKKISPASLMNDTQSIAELNFTKTLLEETLKYGKVALEVIIEAYDAEIAEYEEKITFWSALADSYKALMNAWLGIVDEAVVEDGEEEGDEE